MPEALAGAPAASLAPRIRAGDKRAVAAALNLIEDRRPAARTTIDSLLAAIAADQPCGGQRIGLTGPPGVGKSTLTAALAREYRTRGVRVGVVAVDPSSVRSGGALLGDRARMSFDPSDAGLFVRSLATGGEAGGLAYAVPAAVEVLAAAFDVVIVETTGVGQTETDVEHVVDTVCLVIQPGSGDVLQFIKAGIMEIPDVLVVNKGDHGRLAQQAASDLAGALDTLQGVGVAQPGSRGAGSAGADWRVPVCVTSARDRTGIDQLADVLGEHRATLVGAGLSAKRRDGAAAWAGALFQRLHGDHGVQLLGGKQAVASGLRARLEAGATAPAAAHQLSEQYLKALRVAPGT